MTINIGVRNTAVRMYKEHIRSIRRVALYTNTSKSSVQRWVATHPATRLTSQHPSRKRITDDMGQMLRTELERDPFLTMQQVTHKLREAFRTTLSESCVRGYVRRQLKFTRKRTYARAPDTDKIISARREFVTHLNANGITADDIISVDETCFYLHMRPKTGYAARGRRLLTNIHHRRHCKVTMLLAISSQGILHWQVLEGSANSHTFAEFVSSIPPLPHHTHLLMDNVSFHKCSRVIEAIRAAGLTPLFTPPYTPEWNPVEYAFSVIKRAYRRHAVASNDARPPFDVVHDTLQTCIDDDLVAYNPERTFASVWTQARAGLADARGPQP